MNIATFQQSSAGFQRFCESTCVWSCWHQMKVFSALMTLCEGNPPVIGRLTHWGRVTHICVGKLTNIGSDNGLSPGRRQAIIWTNAGILSIGPLGINFSEILIKIHTFSFKKMRLQMSSGKWRPSCLGLNVLTGLTQPLALKCIKRHFKNYRKVSNIRRTKFQNLRVSRPVLQLSWPNLLKPCIKSRMKM